MPPKKLTLKLNNFVIFLHNKNQPDSHFFKIYSNNILYRFRIDELFILSRQFTVHAVCGIYRASMLTGC
jgi:hypothetical protein